MNYYRASFGLFLFVISSVALGLLLQALDLTSNFSDFGGVLFCERGWTEAVPLQKVNSWSSLIYNIIGLVALFESPFTWLSWISGDIVPNEETLPIRIVFAMSMTILGYGSFAFHAFFLRSTALVDFCGIMAIIVLFLSFSILRFFTFGKTNGRLLPLFFSLLMICMAIRLALWYTLSYDATVPLFSLALVHVLLELYMNISLILGRAKSKIQARFITLHRKNSLGLSLEGEPNSIFLLPSVAPYVKREWRWFVAGFICFSIAGLLWILDGFGVCQPESPFQLHSIWHVLTALASLCSYYYALTLVVNNNDNNMNNFTNNVDPSLL